MQSDALRTRRKAPSAVSAEVEMAVCRASLTHDRPKPQLGGAAGELLAVRVIEVAEEDLLGERERPVEPDNPRRRAARRCEMEGVVSSLALERQ
jgi:hypothetical protein